MEMIVEAIELSLKWSSSSEFDEELCSSLAGALADARSCSIEVVIFERNEERRSGSNCSSDELSI